MNSEGIFRELKTIIDQRHLSPQTYESYRAGWKTACWYFSQPEHLRDHPKNISKQDIIEFLAWVGIERGVSKLLNFVRPQHKPITNKGHSHVTKQKENHRTPQESSGREIRKTKHLSPRSRINKDLSQGDREGGEAA